MSGDRSVSAPLARRDLLLSQQVISMAWSGDGLKDMLGRSRGFTPRGNRCIVVLLNAPGSPATVCREAFDHKVKAKMANKQKIRRLRCTAG